MVRYVWYVWYVWYVCNSVRGLLERERERENQINDESTVSFSFFLLFLTWFCQETEVKWDVVFRRCSWERVLVENIDAYLMEELKKKKNWNGRSDRYSLIERSILSVLK